MVVTWVGAKLWVWDIFTLENPLTDTSDWRDADWQTARNGIENGRRSDMSEQEARAFCLKINGQPKDRQTGSSISIQCWTDGQTNYILSSSSSRFFVLRTTLILPRHFWLARIHCSGNGVAYAKHTLALALALTLTLTHIHTHTSERTSAMQRNPHPLRVSRLLAAIWFACRGAKRARIR